VLCTLYKKQTRRSTWSNCKVIISAEVNDRRDFSIPYLTDELRATYLNQSSNLINKSPVQKLDHRSQSQVALWSRPLNWKHSDGKKVPSHDFRKVTCIACMSTLTFYIRLACSHSNLGLFENFALLVVMYYIFISPPPHAMRYPFIWDTGISCRNFIHSTIIPS
jgi:hypothetical protein